MTASIHRRVLLWAMGALLVGAAMLVGGSWWVLMHEMGEVFEDNLKQVALAVANYHRTARPKIRVVRVSDGRDMGVEIPIRNARRTAAILGRSRWMPDSKAIAFLSQNEDGVNGVFVQDFIPGRDTSASLRQLGGFDRERATESFGIAPDGQTLTVAGWEQLFSLFSIEGLPLKKES